MQGAGLAPAPHRARHHQHAVPGARGVRATARCAAATAASTAPRAAPTPRLIPAALATGNVELRPKLHGAQRSRSTQEGRAKSVVYLDADGVEPGAAREASSSSSCTAVESARLLLNSTLGALPQGAGQRQRPGGQEPDRSAASAESRATFRVSQAEGELALARRPGALRQPQPAGLLPDARRRASASARAGRWASCGRTRTPSSRRWGWPRRGQGRRLRQGAQGPLRAYRDTRILQFEIYGEFLATAGHLRHGGAER